MKAALLSLAGILGLLLLTYICTNNHKPMIEADLTQKTTEALAAAKIAGAQVEADGQVITLRGVVPDEAAKAAAGTAANLVFGVSQVTNLLEVKPPEVSAAPVMTKEEHKAAVDCQAQFNNLLKDPIHFVTASAQLEPASYPLLDKLAQASKICPTAVVEIGGHTDASGDQKLNVVLSQERADAAKAYLVSKGVDGKRLTTQGYGATKPVADNTTPQGMEKNRRTEFKVKGL
jgi:outer membrane protein OmpA-like peptidoglycan-associated protein